MKKIFVIAVFSMIYFAASAQNTKVGLYGGANFLKVNMQSPELSSDTKAGYQIGAYFRAGEILYGQVGLEYQRVNTNFTLASLPDLNQTDDVSFKSFNLPAYIGVNLLPLTDNVANVRLYGGPVVSYLFDVPVNDLDFTASDFKTLRLNGGVGAGLDILLLSFDVAYNFGVNELFTDEFDGKTNYASVNVGLHF